MVSIHERGVSVTDFTSNRSISKGGIILRDKHGPSGIHLREKFNMSYTENVEKYRLSLWVNATRQHVDYPSKAGNRKRVLMNKLMNFARRTGTDHLKCYTDDMKVDLDIGFAGKKLKSKLKELNRTHLGRKHRKVSRTVMTNLIHYASLRNFLSDFSMVPSTPLVEPLVIDNMVSIVLVRNNKHGSITLFDGKVHTRIEFHQNLSLGPVEAILHWLNLQVIRKWEGSSNDIPKPLFKAKPWLTKYNR